MSENLIVFIATALFFWYVYLVITEIPQPASKMDIYNKYLEMLENNVDFSICIEKARNGQCVNNVKIHNKNQLISVFNLAYKTDIKKEINK